MPCGARFGIGSTTRAKTTSQNDVFRTRESVRVGNPVLSMQANAADHTEKAVMLSMSEAQPTSNASVLPQIHFPSSIVMQVSPAYHW